jgi:hypothetical protein
VDVTGDAADLVLEEVAEGLMSLSFMVSGRPPTLWWLLMVWEEAFDGEAFEDPGGGARTRQSLPGVRAMPWAGRRREYGADRCPVSSR